MEQCVIVGGGPAGLSAADALRGLDFPALVLEADQQVGGLARTLQHRGYRFDVGGHRFCTRVPAIMRAWRETLGPDLLERRRLTRILYRDTLFDFPLRPWNTLRGLGVLESARMGLSLLKARLRPRCDESSFENWLVNRFGERLYRTFFKTYTEKVWGMPCSRIAASWATQRINHISLREMVRSIVFGRRDARSAHDAGGTARFGDFAYPRLGPGQFWECVAQRLAEAGRPVRCGLRAEKFRRRNGRVQAVVARQSDGARHEIDGTHFISTMPLRELAEALDPAPPDAVLRAARALRQRTYLAVVLIVRRADVFPDNWIYVHDASVQVGRIQNFKNWSPDMVPDPDRSSLGCEYFLWPDDEKLRWPHHKLVDFARHEAGRIGVVRPDEVEDSVVIRLDNAYPVFDDHHLANTGIVRDFLAGIGNLQSIGRGGQHRYYNQDHAMLSGMYAAENVVGGAYPTWGIDERVRAADGQALERLVPTPVPEAASDPPDAGAPCTLGQGRANLVR